LFELLEDFSRIYQEWNSDDHIHEEVEKCYHRQIKVKELRKCRYRIRKKELRISKKIKYDQHVIDNELDLKTITSLYECFNALCKEAPGIFKNLSKALARYSSRKN
jgi:hypothetical protein